MILTAPRLHPPDILTRAGKPDNFWITYGMKSIPNVFDARKTAGYAFAGFSAIFVFLVAMAYCFSSKYWLLDADPTFPYLLNGLNLATGHTVGHTDHPGTVLQLLCALSLRISYLFAPDARSNTIVQSVLGNPEWYLKNIYIGLFALQAFVLAVVMARVWTSFNNLTLLLVLLTGLFANPLLIALQAAQLRPEIVMPSLVLLLTLVTLKRWWEDATAAPQNPSRVLAWSAGALTGLALFTKITCFPVFVISFFFWNEKRSRWYYAIGFFCIALLCLPALWDSLGATFSWFIRLTMHDGRYGVGSTDLLSVKSFYTNIIAMLSANIFTVVLLVLTLVGLFIFRKKSHALGWKIASLHMISAITIAVVVAKQYYEERYLITVYMTAFLAPFVFISLQNNAKIKVLSCVVCVVLIFSSLSRLYNHTEYPSGSNIKRKYAVGGNFSGKFFYYSDFIKDNASIVERYDSYSLTYGLAFGNYYAKGLYGDILRLMYPHCFTYYLLGDPHFTHFGKRVSFEEVAAGRPVFIRGTYAAGSRYPDGLILGRRVASFPEGDNMYELLRQKNSK